MADLAHLYAVALRAYKPAEAAAARPALPARGAAPAAHGGAACGLQLAGLAAHVQARPHERAYLYPTLKCTLTWKIADRRN